jgi:uroporphyrinogen III methyltransferase/synthase
MVVSGSEDPSKTESSIPWEVVARTGGTVVVLMGWAALESILDTLRREGMPASTPVALVQWGTWPKQRTVTGNLADVVARGQEVGLNTPVAAIIGPVVALRDRLRWFDRRPLFGKKVLITRSRAQASQLRVLLEELGAQTVELPAIEIAPLEDYSGLDEALARLGQFQWLIFASANAVEAVFTRLERQHRDARAFANTRVAAIGPATEEVLVRRGIIADFVPSRSVSEIVVEELSGLDWAGVSVLLPAADIGRDVLAQGLSRLGARVERVAAYRTISPEGVSNLARGVLEQGVDVVTFTSSSTVQNLWQMLEGNVEVLASSLVACIGPATAATAQELGLRVDLVADEHTIEGLAKALVSHFGEKPSPPSLLPVGRD